MESHDVTEDDIPRHRWLPAAVALMQTRTLEEAANLIGCSTRSLQRWMDAPGFAKLQAEVEQSYVEAASRRLLCLSHQALDTLAAIMADTSTPPGARVRASLGLLDVGLRYREAVALDRRLRRLEDLLNGTEPANTPHSR